MRARAHWLQDTVQSHSWKLCPAKASKWQAHHAPVDDKAGLKASWVHLRARCHVVSKTKLQGHDSRDEQRQAIVICIFTRPYLKANVGFLKTSPPGEEGGLTL